MSVLEIVFSALATIGGLGVLIVIPRVIALEEEVNGLLKALRGPESEDEA